jgi:Raf kinase inhibitor-like YbhB/YbcL family protein
MELSHTLRALGSMPHIFLGGVPQERAGEERLAWRRLHLQPDGFRLFCDSFSEDEAIPRQHAADGGNLRPLLRWAGIPPGTKSLALLVEDPDSPTVNPFVHWLVYNIPLDADDIADAIGEGARQGLNSMFGSTWTGCAPPKGDTPHRYVFQLFALDRPLDLGENAGRSAFLKAMKGHVLGCAVTMGTYQR